MKCSLLCNEPRIWKDCHFKASLESCRPCCLLTCQTGIKRSPIIISLFSNEPIVYLHLGWQPSGPYRFVEALEVDIQMLLVFARDSLQHTLKVLGVFLKRFVALGNSDLVLCDCQAFLPKKRQFGRFSTSYEGNFELHFVVFLCYLNKSSDKFLRCVTFSLLGLRMKNSGWKKCVLKTRLSFLFHNLLTNVLSLI